MKRIVKLLLLIIILLNIGIVNAEEEKNLVNIYFFHSNQCTHCKAENKLLKELEEKYDNIVIYRYEISNPENLELLTEVSKMFDVSTTRTPFTVIGDKEYVGFSYEHAKSKFIATIEYYSDNGYNDRVGTYIGNIPLPKYEINENAPNIDDYIKERTSYKISIFGKKIELKNLTLPIISMIIGLVDGFNPCAMWVLLFLISMLIGMKDRKKMLVLGLTFLLTSALIYLLFMLAWLNVATFLLTINYVRIAIGLIAIVGSIINLRSYIRHRKDNGCDVIDEKKRTKIFDRIKKFTHENNYLLAIIGVIILAVSVNIVELACSAGLPVMFTQILSMNELSTIEYAIYILIYMFFFLIDDLAVFFIAMTTMQLTGFSTKYGKLSKLVGGLLLLLIGLLMIFKPEWLMFSF